MEDVKFISHNNILFYGDLLSRTHFINNLQFLWALLESSQDLYGRKKLVRTKKSIQLWVLYKLVKDPRNAHDNLTLYSFLPSKEWE